MELDTLEPLLVVEKESSSRKSTPRKSDEKSTTSHHKSEHRKKSDKPSKKSESVKDKQKKSKEKAALKEPANDLFASMGLYSVDDLIGRTSSPELQSEVSEVQEVGSVASEIRTDSESVQQYESDFESDIYSEHSRSRSPSPKLKAKRSKSLEVISEADVISSARSVATYSDDLETLHTEKTESISDDGRSNKRRGSYSDSESNTLTRSRSPSPSYSDSSTYTDSYSYTYESYTRSDSRSDWLIDGFNGMSTHLSYVMPKQTKLKFTEKMCQLIHHYLYVVKFKICIYRGLD